MDAARLLGDLDEHQRSAVSTPSTLVAVIAAAGSGKTRVLARRIAYRVAASTADARHTLALTFTREAAGELRRRLRASGLRDHVEAGTFHSVALGLLRQRWADLGRPAPTIISDRERLLGDVAGAIPVETLAAERTWSAARGVAAADYEAVARSAKRRVVGAPAARIAEVLDDYEQLKRRRGVVDLDDLLLFLARDLATDAAFAEATRWRFRHVLVDEAQDLNPVQHRLLRVLVEGRNDLFLVGDPAQAIYAFNGSDPGLLIDVDRHLPGIEIVRLPVNRRSTTQVVAAGNHILDVSGQGAGVVAARGHGPGVEVVVCDDETHEADTVARLLRRMPHGRIHAGDVAVLARTHEQLHALRLAIGRAGIPIRRAALAPGTPLAASVREATMQRSAAQLRAWAHDVLDSPPEPGPDRVGRQTERELADRRVGAAVLEFLREQPHGDGFALRTWVAANSPFTDSADSTGIDLLTFHAAKGREWTTVIVTGVETGLVPHRSAGTVESRAEEARLLHVAVTRASDELVITRAERRRGYARQASPYIVGIPTQGATPVAAPPEVHRDPAPRDVRAAALVAWRAAAARAASLLPDQICSDDDLHSIARAAPTSPEALAAVTSFGPIAAARLFTPIRSALDAAEP